MLFIKFRKSIRKSLEILKKRLSIKNNKEKIIKKKYLKDIKKCNLKIPLYLIFNDNIYKPYILYEKKINILNTYEIYISYESKQINVGNINLLKNINIIKIFIPIYKEEHYYNFLNQKKKINKDIINLINEIYETEPIFI